MTDETLEMTRCCPRDGLWKKKNNLKLSKHWMLRFVFYYHYSLSGDYVMKWIEPSDKEKDWICGNSHCISLSLCMKTLDTPHCNDDVALSERFNYNDDEMRSDRARLVLTFTSVLDPFLSPPLQPSVTPYEWMWLNRNEADGERLNQAMTVCCIILRLFEYQKRFFFFTIYSFLPLHSQQTYIRSHPQSNYHGHGEQQENAAN